MDGSEKKISKEKDGGWQFHSENAQPVQSSSVSQDPTPTSSSAVDVVEWSASEFVAHDKGFGWYALLAVGSIVAAVLTYLVTRDRFSVGVVLLFAIFLGIIGARKPRVVVYRLDGSGVHIGANFHPYSEYKSFALRDEQPFASIELMPLKRFGLPLGIYLAPETENQVLDVLSRHLPLERGQLGSTERLMRHLRF